MLKGLEARVPDTNKAPSTWHGNSRNFKHKDNVHILDTHTFQMLGRIVGQAI